MHVDTNKVVKGKLRINKVTYLTSDYDVEPDVFLMFFHVSLTQCTLICQFVCGEVGDNNEVKDSKELGAWRISLLSHSSGSLCDGGCW